MELSGNPLSFPQNDSPHLLAPIPEGAQIEAMKIPDIRMGPR